MGRRSRRNVGTGGPQFSGPSAPRALPRAYEYRMPTELELVRQDVPQPFVARPARIYAPGVARFSPPAPRSPWGRGGMQWNLVGLKMRAPSRVRFCFQRKVRREVMFALGVGGRGGKPGRRFRRTQNSQYRC